MQMIGEIIAYTMRPNVWIKTSLNIKKEPPSLLSVVFVELSISVALFCRIIIFKFFASLSRHVGQYRNCY